MRAYKYLFDLRLKSVDAFDHVNFKLDSEI